MKLVFSVLNVISLLSILAWPFMFFGGIFMFDAPGSLGNPIYEMLFFLILVYPVSIILGNILFWKNKDKKTNEVLGSYTIISLLGPFAILVLFLFI